MQNCSNPEIAEDKVNWLYVSLAALAPGRKMRSAIMASVTVETAEWGRKNNG
jgi:hypothetical protein